MLAQACRPNTTQPSHRLTPSKPGIKSAARIAGQAEDLDLLWRGLVGRALGLLPHPSEKRFLKIYLAKYPRREWLKPWHTPPIRA